MTLIMDENIQDCKINLRNWKSAVLDIKGSPLEVRPWDTLSKWIFALKAMPLLKNHVNVNSLSNYFEVFFYWGGWMGEGVFLSLFQVPIYLFRWYTFVFFCVYVGVRVGSSNRFEALPLFYFCSSISSSHLIKMYDLCLLKSFYYDVEKETELSTPLKRLSINFSLEAIKMYQT